jgi:hypothetical protein
VRVQALFSKDASIPSSLYEVKQKDIDGKDVDMSIYKGKVGA